VWARLCGVRNTADRKKLRASLPSDAGLTFRLWCGESTISLRELSDCGVQMAQKVSVTFVDDLDGGEAEGTVVFGVDGKQYEIDLSERNAAKLRDILAPYVGAGRKVGGGSRTPRMSSVPRTNREDTKAIRDWATAQGMNVSSRGRIAADVLEAYKARGETSAAVEPVAVEPDDDAPVRKGRSRAKAEQPEFSGAE
jgi:hypothetical protein